MILAAGKRLSVELLSEALSGTGISIPPGAAERLLLHANEMLLWNRSIRLTSITAPDEIAVKHILDSLLLLAFSPFPGMPKKYLLPSTKLTYQASPLDWTCRRILPF